MTKKKTYFTVFLALLAGFAVLIGCAVEGAGGGPRGGFPGADAGENVTLSDTGLLLFDKELAIEIPAVRNQNRGNASGPKIPSGVYSEEFPGIYFIWDSKSDNNGYLLVDGALFNVYESFVLTAKESNEYWDFFIKPRDGQQTAEDGRYIFFLPRTSGKNNINMVFLSEWAEKEEPPVVPPGTDEFPSIPFQVSAALNHMGGTNGHDLLAIVRSKEELNRAAETRYYQYWTDAGGPYNVYYLAEATEKYDEEFFTENALVLYLFGAANAGGAIDITQIQRQDSKLTLITDFHMGVMPAGSSWTVVIEVAQADVYGVTTLDTSKTPLVVPPKTDPGNGDVKEVDNLLEKHGLSVGWGIGNDYMPVIVYPLQSIFTIHFDSATQLPPMEVSATVITEKITIPVSLHDIYGGNGTYGRLFRKDFRPVDHFRLNDGEEYTIKATVKILGEQQTITFEKGKVGVTS